MSEGPIVLPFKRDIATPGYVNQRRRLEQCEALLAEYDKVRRHMAVVTLALLQKSGPVTLTNEDFVRAQSQAQVVNIRDPGDGSGVIYEAVDVKAKSDAPTGEPVDGRPPQA